MRINWRSQSAQTNTPAIRPFVARPDKNFLSAIKLLAKHTGPSIHISAFEEPEDLERIMNGQPLAFIET